MKQVILFLVLFTTQVAVAQNSITTFILLRHAEKANDRSKDPDLSDAGMLRAESLVRLFANTNIDAIFSTAYKRTQNTVIPLAKAHSLTISNYDGSKMEEIDELLEKHKGQTILLSGHSDTTPAIANYLKGHKDEFKTFDDKDFGNIIILSIVRRGEAKVTWLRY
jgi:2,3-bisphosphoglycerate-dependent phosphoglycerate mutase